MKCQVLLLLAAVVVAVRSSPVGRETPEEGLPNTIPLDQISPHIPEAIPEATPEKTVKDLPEDSQESDEDSWSILIPKGRTGIVNFFPISFGAARSGSSLGSTAIANSFSTGRKGAATSHATAYGDPSLRNWEGRN